MRAIFLLLVGVLALAMTGCATPPTFTMPLDVRYVIGGQISPSIEGDNENAYTWDARWVAPSASGAASSG